MLDQLEAILKSSFLPVKIIYRDNRFFVSVSVMENGVKHTTTDSGISISDALDNLNESMRQDKWL